MNLDLNIDSESSQKSISQLIQDTTSTNKTTSGFSYNTDNSNNVVNETIENQITTNPLPPRPSLPSRKILYQEIKQTLRDWYLNDSKKSLQATIYFWTTYRYLTRSNFRCPQQDEILRSGSLITYFNKYRLGWHTTIYYQGIVDYDDWEKITLSNNHITLWKKNFLYFVQLSIDEQFQILI